MQEFRGPTLAPLHSRHQLPHERLQRLGVCLPPNDSAAHDDAVGNACDLSCLLGGAHAEAHGYRQRRVFADARHKRGQASRKLGALPRHAK